MEFIQIIREMGVIYIKVTFSDCQILADCRYIENIQTLPKVQILLTG